MVPNNSSEVNVVPEEVATQSMFEKEGSSPSVTGGKVARRRPNGHATSQAATSSGADRGEAGRAAVEEGSVINKVILAGRVGRDADVRHTKDGRMVANFSLGTDNSYKDRFGEWQRKTAWHRVQVWGEVAETVSPGLLKRARVYVEGKLINRNWVDKQSKRRTSTEVVASEVRFLDPASKKEPAGNGDLAEEPGSAAD